MTDAPFAGILNFIATLKCICDSNKLGKKMFDIKNCLYWIILFLCIIIGTFI